MLMKKGLFQESIKALLNSFDHAKQDGSDHSDAARFKTQELHMINQLLSGGFSHIDYQANSKFVLPRSLKNHHLIETNMNAFRETFELDKV